MATNGKHAGISDDAVRAKTGKTWQQWIDALDRAGGRAMSHQEVAALLSDKFGVPPWWTQMVTVGYEQAIGKRVAMQKADGFAASASRTINVSAAAVFKAFNDSRSRSLWLADEFTIRKATAPKSLRITWKDGKSHVDVNIYAKGARKAQISLQHTKLASARTAEQMKKYWRSALAELAQALEA
jgi:uncharacterized protein YndB with AHSA1/START domain